MQLGKYRLVKRIGRGGMGEVWEGTLAGEHGFERRVAIKRMNADHGEGWEQRFIDEARIASKLHHANIVSVLDYGVEEGAPFQVLELIDGINAQHLYERAKPLPVELALHICVEVAHGLASAHAQHIVHRDVSLENVLLSWEGDVKLSDFGVAKARDRAFLTGAGVVGKPAYMAPEQATGGDVDGRTDVFALGCALHSLLAGATPLAGEDRLAKLLTGTALPIDPSIPGDVAALIAKAVARSKGERFASAEAMADALAKLRHSRMSREPRVALREFLQRLKPRKATGALDALLAPAQTATPSVPAAALASTVTRAPPRTAVPWVIAVAVFAAAGGGAVALWSSREPAPVSVPVKRPALVDAAKPAPPPPEETPPPPVAVIEKTVKPKLPPPAKPAEPKPLGSLLIGGAGAQRAEILIDGKSVGFAPKRVEVTVGQHDVVLVAPDGKRIGPHRVEVSARNTDLDPARWLLDEP